MIPYSYYRLLSVIVLVIIFVSCKKLISVPPPTNLLTTQQVFSNDATAQLAINGIYITTMDSTISFLNGGMSLFPGLSADELSGSLPNTTEQAFTLNALDGGNNDIAFLYEKAYILARSCNTILGGIQQSTGMTASAKAEMTGEALFMRSLVYFYLVNLWGDVPLVTSTDYKVTALQPKIAGSVIYDSLIADLIQAKNNLPADYTNNPGSVGQRIRPNAAAATALLARVYLYLGRWADAEASASQIISNPLYALAPNLDSVFLSKSREAIFQLKPTNGIATSEGYFFNPAPGLIPNYHITSFLQSAWEPGDKRASQWTKTVTVNGKTYTYPYKYKLRYDAAVTESNTVFRLAEIYLIRAEAEAELNDLPDAITDLNTVRGRAGLPGTSAANQAGLLTAIQHERQLELFAEWGHRWLDLKRTAGINIVLGIEKPGWKSTDALYPFVSSDLLVNPNLVQNAGY